MKNRRGEIATLLTVGTLVVIGVATIVSSLNLGKKTSSNARASDTTQTCPGATDASPRLAIGAKSGGLTCCGPHLGTKFDVSYSTWDATCKSSAAPAATICKTTAGCLDRVECSTPATQTDDCKKEGSVCCAVKKTTTTTTQTCNSAVYINSTCTASCGPQGGSMHYYCSSITQPCNSGAWVNSTCTASCGQTSSLHYYCSNTTAPTSHNCNSTSNTGSCTADCTGAPGPASVPYSYYCGTQPICNAGSNSTGCTTACTLGSAPTYYGYYCPPVVVPEKSCTTGTHLTGTPGTQNCSMVCEAKGGLYISNTQWNSENNTVLNCCCKNVVAPATDTPQGLYPQNNNGRTEGMACCFLQKGKVRIYASATARANNGMNTPCTDAVYGNTYGATRWFECPNDTVDGGAQADYETANTPVPTTCTVTDTGKVIPKDEKFHCISNVEFARCDAQNNAVVTHCGGNLTCQVGEGAWGDGCANPEVAVSPIVSPVVSPVVDPASNCELLSANCGAGNAHYQGVDTFSYYKSKSTACASVSTTSNQACYSYSSPTSCNEVTWGNIDTHYCVEGAPITLPTACPGTNINCNDQSGVCGAAGGDTGQSYYKTNASPYNIIDGATCKPKTETEMKTICKCKTAAVVDSNVTIACQRYTCTEACSTVSKTCPFNDCNTRIVHKSNQGIWFDDSTCNTYPLGANVEDITKCMCTAPQVAAAPTVSNDAKCVTATGIAQSYCGNTGGGCGTYGFGPNNGYQCSSSFWGTAYCCTPNLVMIVINNKCTNSMTVGATSRFSKTIAAGGSDYVSTETMTSINVVIYRVAGAYSSKSFSPSTSGYVLNLEGDYCN